MTADGTVHAVRLQGRLPAVLRARLERAGEGSAVRRGRHAAPRRGRGRRNLERREHGLPALPDAHCRRDRGDRAQWLRRAQAHVLAEDGRRRVDGHDEPHRTAGRVGPGRGAHEGGPAGATARTSSTAARSSSRTASTTTPTTSCISCSRARPTRHPASRAFRCSSCPKFLVEGGRKPRRAQRRPLRLARAQARHPCQSNRGPRVRRPGRRRRLPGRRGEPRARIHVRDDELRPLRRRHAGRGDRRARLSARRRLRARARAGPTCRGVGGRRADQGDHRSPGRAADADDDARMQSRPHVRSAT